MKSVLLVFSLCLVPLLAQQGANLPSVEKERALGRHLASEIRKHSKPLADPGVDPVIADYVRRIQRELVTHLKDAPFDYHFEAILDGSRTEPFSLPGGYVFIPAHAFVAARDEAEFVGMLAHSIGHIALRHGMRRPTVDRL
jgi:predicted Zn-dependent protease